METAPYIGASISLVSKAGIRYEGTLFTIDTKASNIALQNGASPADRALAVRQTVAAARWACVRAPRAFRLGNRV
jgi:hypothetical protein